MAIDRLHLADFRNHRATGLTGARGFNLLLGPNGAGKTNVLEAISLFAPGRGLRRAGLADMIRDGAAHAAFAIGADLVSGQTPVRIGTSVQPDNPGRRIMQVSGAPIPGSRLAEWLSVSWLTPAMDRLFTDSPGGRRRFLDRMAVALEPDHALQSAAYEKALRERNRLLAGRTAPDPIWLDALEIRLAMSGAAIVAARLRTIDALGTALAELEEGPFATPLLSIPGRETTSVEQLQEGWHRSRPADRAAGRTLAGPHRDDLSVTMRETGRPAAECSTGEQKAMLIAMILAHAEKAAGARPLVLLLDEVAAHLDARRRGALYERLAASGAQVWMTGTDMEPFAAIAADSAVWHVSEGSAEPR